MMQILTLSADDAERYQTLRLRALKDHPESFGASYEQEAALTIEQVKNRLMERLHAESFILAAEMDGQLVSMIGLGRQAAAKIRHKAYIWGVYTIPEKRGLGLSKTLLNAAIDRAKTFAGLEMLQLSVVTMNIQARKIYLDRGFEIYGLERRALKLDDKTYLDEEHLVLYL